MPVQYFSRYLPTPLVSQLWQPSKTTFSSYNTLYHTFYHTILFDLRTSSTMPCHTGKCCLRHNRIGHVPGSSVISLYLGLVCTGWVGLRLNFYVKGRERYLLPPARLYERRFRSAKTQKHICVAPRGSRAHLTHPTFDESRSQI